MMGILIFSALPLVTASEGHIVVGLFDGLFRGVAGRIRIVMIDLVSLGALGLIVYLMNHQGAMLARFRKITGYLELPLSPLAYVMMGLTLLAMVAQLAVLWHHLRSPMGDAE